jgi:arabinan endo-1,5-alpha-L-arabinosidase
LSEKDEKRYNLKDEKGYFIIHHARDGENKDLPYLHVRKIFWSKEGWPMVSPERYAGEENRKIVDDEIIGNWFVSPPKKEKNNSIKACGATKVKKKSTVNSILSGQKETTLLILTVPK